MGTPDNVLPSLQKDGDHRALPALAPSRSEVIQKKCPFPSRCPMGLRGSQRELSRAAHPNLA